MNIGQLRGLLEFQPAEREVVICGADGQAVALVGTHVRALVPKSRRIQAPEEAERGRKRVFVLNPGAGGQQVSQRERDEARARVAELEAELEDVRPAVGHVVCVAKEFDLEIADGLSVGGRSLLAGQSLYHCAASFRRERDALRARVAGLEDRLRRGIILVNAAKMGDKSAAPKLAAWADERKEGESELESDANPD